VVTARYDSEGRYLGGPGLCEHRTVGSHRAWCFTCSEWCYPDAMCVRCSQEHLDSEVEHLRQRLAAAEAVCEALDASASPVGVTTALDAWRAVKGEPQ
jgi:hypothetical protein